MANKNLTYIFKKHRAVYVIFLYMCLFIFSEALRCSYEAQRIHHYYYSIYIINRKYIGSYFYILNIGLSPHYAGEDNHFKHRNNQDLQSGLRLGACLD